MTDCVFMWTGLIELRGIVVPEPWIAHEQAGAATWRPQDDEAFSVMFGGWRRDMIRLSGSCSYSLASG